MSAEESKFYLWLNSTEVKQKIQAAYSIGASIVIIGAMFKILHLPYASYMLGTGMCVEAFLFALGVFDKPHKEMDWDKVFNTEAGPINLSGSSIAGGSTGGQIGGGAAGRNVGLNYTETIDDDDVKKLSESIKNLTETAHHLSTISGVIGATEDFSKSIESATATTNKYTQGQESLNTAALTLGSSYQGIIEGMDAAEKNTKAYAGKIESINKNLSSINSIYEIQLKNIQAQTEGLNLQSEKIKDVYTDLEAVAADIQKMKTASEVAASETENYKVAATKLSKQIESLNNVYGNMLNALN